MNSKAETIREVSPGVFVTDSEDAKPPISRPCPECAKPMREMLGMSQRLDWSIVPKGQETGWVPPDGIDPHLWEFKCSVGHVFYYRGVLRDNIGATQAMFFDVRKYERR